MGGYLIAVAVAAWICCAVGTAAGDSQRIGILRVEQKRLAAIRDSLEARRRFVVAEAEELSARIDSLKGMPGASESEELHEALRASLGLVQRMVEIDCELDRTKARQDSVEERLRLAYDWEIGMLIQKISQSPDQGLLAQLMVYQEAREALGNEPVGANLRYGAEMDIRPEDGPEEIRQKMELMEDIAARLRMEAQKTSEQLRRLEEDYRIRSEMRRTGGTKGSPLVPPVRGRLLLGRLEAASASVPLDGRSGAKGSGRPGLLVGASVRGVGDGNASSSPEQRAMELMVLEIHKLKVHQEEIRQLEVVVRERAATFRKYLRKMLEGKE